MEAGCQRCPRCAGGHGIQRRPPCLRAGPRWSRRPLQRQRRDRDQAALRDALRLPGRLSRPAAWLVRGAATAKYEVIGNWNPQTRTAHEDLYSFDRGQGETDAWTCNEDPWITPAIYPDESGWPNGHVCQLQSQRGGGDWMTDTNPPASFGDVMCFNDPWGVSLEGCWSSDDITVTGPSAAVLRAWEKA